MVVKFMIPTTQTMLWISKIYLNTYSPAYAESKATIQFNYLDTSRHAEERSAQATYNKGFAESL